jgi:HAMP domain-containing protein
MFGRLTRFSLITLTVVFALTLFNACETEVEYRDVIKEVPVEVPVEIPVEVPIEVPVNVPFEDETRINDLNRQLEELRQSYEAQLEQLNAAYNERLEELQSLNTGNQSLLQGIEELQNTHRRETVALNESYSAQIADLQSRLNDALFFYIYELRVYKMNDPDRGYDHIINQTQARSWYTSYVANSVPEQCVFYSEFSFRRAVEQSPYVTVDADTIINQIAENRFDLVYGSYWQDGYFIFWFVKPLW